MTSKEMEERSGVPRANIRYYEAEGLLSPSRAKNGYRAYSEEDLAALEKIKLLRRLGVTMEELKDLTAGRLELAAVLDRRLAEVGGERASLDRVEEVCGRLRTAGETFAGLDAGAYLDALDAPALPPEGGEVWWKAAHAPSLPETDALPVCTSIPRRLFARLFDELGMRMLVLCAMALLGTNPVSHATAITLLAGVLLLFVEPLLLHLLGTTPGKALMGLRLEAPGGRKLTYEEGFTRYLLLLWYGLGLGVPIFNLVRYYQCAKRCGEGEPQPWDADIAYIEKPFRWVNPAAYLLAAVLAMAAAETVNAWSQLPPNRGELTVAEFAENFNRQADYLDMTFSGQRLDENGRWEDLPVHGTVYIAVGDWGPKNLPFTYTVENGRLTAVTLSAEKENTEDWLTLPTSQMEAAAMAYTWAQKEAPFRAGARRELLEQMESAGLEGFTLRQGGTMLTLEVRQRGFRYSDSLGLLLPEEGNENFCSFTFTIALEEEQ